MSNQSIPEGIRAGASCTFLSRHKMARVITSIAVLLLFTAMSWGQTFEVNGQNSTPPKPTQNKVPRKQGQPSSRSSDSGMGWGSSIEVARQARAAQDALRRRDYGSAVNFAQRATKAAPQN